MHDLFQLSGPSFSPASGGAARELVILLHGWGADGNELIDPMPKARPLMRLDRNAKGLEHGFRLPQRLDRKNLVGAAVNEKDGRLRRKLLLEHRDTEQQTQIAEHARTRNPAPKGDIKRGHRPLGEADKGKFRLVEAALCELGVDEGVDHGGHGLHPGEYSLRRAINQTDPLAAEPHVARERSMGG